MTSVFRCPTCQKAVLEASKLFPFCCDRCRLLDLGKWLNEEYKVTRPLKPQTDAQADQIEDEEEGTTEDELDE